MPVSFVCCFKPEPAEIFFLPTDASDSMLKLNKKPVFPADVSTCFTQLAGRADLTVRTFDLLSLEMISANLFLLLLLLLPDSARI